MPSQIKVIQATDFIRARPAGELDLEASEELLAAIVKASANLDDYEILVDTRQAEGTLSASDLWFLAQRLVSHRKTFSRKMAVLCPEERFDRARFFALCGENQGFNIRAFVSYEEAMDWLNGEAA